MADETVTAGIAIADALDKAGVSFESMENGYITSVNDISAGMFGGYDGWMYAVKYYTLNADGTIQMYIDIPSVSANDYKITSNCQIVLYYGDYGIPFAGFTVTEDNLIKLVSYSPVYDENYKLVSFEEAPLAGGTMVFNQFDPEGEIDNPAEPFVFTADENGMTAVDGNFKAVPNGTYYMSVGKQVEATVETGDSEKITASKPAAVRSSDVYVVFNEKSPEEIKREKVELLLIGFNGGRSKELT